MAPLTRSRSEQPGDIPGDLMKDYYSQRASEGGLIITEATTVSLTARGWFGAPGLYSGKQVEGWKRIVGAVHEKGGQIISQLWHTGRSSHVSMTGGPAPGTASVNPSYWEDDEHQVSIPSGWSRPSPHRALVMQTRLPSAATLLRTLICQSAFNSGCRSTLTIVRPSTHSMRAAIPTTRSQSKPHQDCKNRKQCNYAGSVRRRTARPLNRQKSRTIKL